MTNPLYGEPTNSNDTHSVHLCYITWKPGNQEFDLMSGHDASSERIAEANNTEARAAESLRGEAAQSLSTPPENGTRTTGRTTEGVWLDVPPADSIYASSARPSERREGQQTRSEAERRESARVIQQLEAESRDAHRDSLVRPGEIRQNETGDGHRNQRRLYAAIQEVMSQRFGDRPSLAEQGWRIFPSANNSTADRAGIDFVLANSQTGQWIPLDVTDHRKEVGGRGKVYYERYNVRDIFTNRTGTTLADPASFEQGLRRYIETRPSFDVARVRPPELAAEADPQRRLTQLDEFRRRIQTESEQARQQGATGSEQAERYREALTTLEQQHARHARTHLDQELSLRRSATAALVEHLTTHHAYYADPRNSSAAPTDRSVAAAASEMLRFENGALVGTENTSGTNGPRDRNYHAGDVRSILNDAVSQLPENIRESVRRGLGDPYGPNRSATNRAVIENLERAIRQGLTSGDHAWEPLDRVASRQRNERQQAERRAQREVEGPRPVVSEEHANTYLDRTNRAIQENRQFRVAEDGRIVSTGGREMSMSDIARQFQESAHRLANAPVPDQQRLQRERENWAGTLETAMNSQTPTVEVEGRGRLSLRQAQIDAATASLSGRQAEQVRELLGRAEFRVDRSNTVQSGQPQVRLFDTRSGSGQPLQVTGYERNGVRVQGSNQVLDYSRVRAEIVVPAGPTLASDMLLGHTQLVTDTTRDFRQTEQFTGVSREGVVQYDRQAMERLRDRLSQPTIARDADLTLRQVWREYDLGEFPNLRNLNEESRSQLRDVVQLSSDLSADLARRETNPSLRRHYEQTVELLRNYQQELVSRRSGGPVGEMISSGHRIPSQQARPVERPAGDRPPAPAKPVEQPRTQTEFNVRDRVEHRGNQYQVSGRYDGLTIVHSAPERATAQRLAPLSSTERAHFVEVQVTVGERTESRWIDRRNPSGGLFRLTEIGDQTFRAADTEFRVVPQSELRRSTQSGSSTTTRPADHAAPTNERAPERPRRQRFSAADFSSTEVQTDRDGRVRIGETRVGEGSHTRTERTEVTAEHLSALEQEAQRLQRSSNATERENGRRLQESVEACRGNRGAEAQREAHRFIAERTRRGGGGGGAVGAGVGLGILVSAALAWHLSRQEQQRPQRRPTFS